jgi:SAM-dependent methyltransferase
MTSRLSAALTLPALLALGCTHGHHGHGHHGHGGLTTNNPGDMDQYIGRLESPERDAWQRPDAVVAQLGLTGTELVADVGAGVGYFSLRFAKALPGGRVVALEVEPRMVDHLRARLVRESVANVEVTLTKIDDPGTPAAADVVFVCNVLHHVDAQVREAWFGRLAANLKPGARLALLEFKEGKLEVGPPEEEKLPRAELLAIAQRHGLVLAEERPEVVPTQHFLVFRKP